MICQAFEFLERKSILQTFHFIPLNCSVRLIESFLRAMSRRLTFLQACEAMGVYDEDDNFSSDEEDLTQGVEVTEHVSSDGDARNSNDLDLPDAEVLEN